MDLYEDLAVPGNRLRHLFHPGQPEPRAHDGFHCRSSPPHHMARGRGYQTRAACTGPADGHP